MDRFNKLYEKQGFMDRYNGSVFIAGFVFLVFFVIFSYFYVRRHTSSIRANWTKERCSPTVIPFAGFINAPKGKGSMEFTLENFNHCVTSIIKESAQFATQPIEAVTNVFHKVFSGFSDAINDIRKVFDDIRSGVEDVSRNIMQRLLLVLIPFQKLIIKVKDTMAKAQGMQTAGLFTVLGAFYSLVSALNVIYKFIVAILEWMAGMIVVFYATLDFGMAATYTAVYTAIAIPAGIVAGALHDIMSMSGLSHCFKKGTLIRAANGTLYAIESLPLGTQLHRGGKVTAVMKLSTEGQTMYKLGNLTVSGTHKVKYNKEWIFVRQHPDAIEISSEDFNDDFIYCLNTSIKTVTIDDYTFLDWDEVTDDIFINKLNCPYKCDIYNKYENGFHPYTLIETKSRGIIPMNKLEVGDILKNEIKVTGIVNIIGGKDLYDYGYFIGTEELGTIQDLGTLRENMKVSMEKTDNLIHILTDSKHFYIKNQKICDYNKNIDYYL